jgi:tRNA threonylcarbamoyladenosine biosynthesis protein TsaB
MLALALDTTTRAGSVALVDDDRVLTEQAGDPSRSHAERLPGDLLRALDAAGRPSSAVDLFVVAAGPGSFTGLRIGIATIQGMALAAGKPVVAISALEALAHLAAADLPPGSVVAAWMDAHRRDVFSALYRVDQGSLFSAARLEEIDPALVGDPAGTLRRWSDAGRLPDVIVGDGAVLYEAHVTNVARVVSPRPLAAALARIGLARVLAGGENAALHPAAVHPLYVRRPDAEVARECRTSPSNA